MHGLQHGVRANVLGIAVMWRQQYRRIGIRRQLKHVMVRDGEQHRRERFLGARENRVGVTRQRAIGIAPVRSRIIFRKCARIDDAKSARQIEKIAAIEIEIAAVQPQHRLPSGAAQNLRQSGDGDARPRRDQNLARDRRQSVPQR